MTRIFSPTQLRATIHLDAIRHNYQVLHNEIQAHLVDSSGAALAPAGGWPCVLPVVKANAYGHGARAVALTLLRAGVEAFASGSLAESVALQEMLTQRSVLATILSLVGATCVEECELAHKHSIVCVLHSFDQLAVYEAAQKPLHLAIKCNSGMGRLGFTSKELPALIDRLSRSPLLMPELVLSHLAAADDLAEGELLHAQLVSFAECVNMLRPQWPDLGVSLGNSAGLAEYARLQQRLGPHTCRPGLALYGIDPFEGAHGVLRKKLRPAMDVVAPVLARRDLAKGEGTGYGLSFKAPAPMQIALVGIGYAHGYSRSFGNKGVICIHGRRCPVVGRVSMQMTAVDTTGLSGVVTGTPAYVLGGPGENAISAYELATLWGTIPYEVTCLLGINPHEYTEA